MDAVALCFCGHALSCKCEIETIYQEPPDAVACCSLLLLTCTLSW